MHREHQSIAWLQIASVAVGQQAESIVWRDAGRAGPAREMRPDGIAAELLELQAAESRRMPTVLQAGVRRSDDGDRPGHVDQTPQWRSRWAT